MMTPWGYVLHWLRCRKIGGEIAMLGLQDWWLNTFTEDERKWIADAYAPMAGRKRPLVEGGPYRPRPHPFGHLSNVATWINKDGYQHCAMAFLRKSMEYCSADLPILDLHFGLAEHCKVFYRWRDVVPGALEGAIVACEMCIAINREAAREFQQMWGIVPAHACFRQLRIIEEKRGNLERALALCEEAQAGGWADDWDKDKSRIRKKMAKAV